MCCIAAVISCIMVQAYGDGLWLRCDSIHKNCNGTYHIATWFFDCNSTCLQPSKVVAKTTIATTSFGAITCVATPLVVATSPNCDARHHHNTCFLLWHRFGTVTTTYCDKQNCDAWRRNESVVISTYHDQKPHIATTWSRREQHRRYSDACLQQTKLVVDTTIAITPFIAITRCNATSPR
jgi:hypothetical protein